MRKPAENILVRELHPDEHRLAEQLEELQLHASVSRSGKRKKHPYLGKDALLQIVDPKLGRPGIVLVSFYDKTPVGFYIALKGEGNSFLTLFNGVHRDYRGLGIATMMHARIKEMLGNRTKQSTMSPHNIPSLVVNVNHEGFRVADWVANRYGPGEHRFYIRGRLNFPQKEMDVSKLAGLDRVTLDKTKTLSAVKTQLHDLNEQRRHYLLELVEEQGHPLETAYKFVDWKGFRGIYIHSEGNRHFLLMKPVAKKR
ncbi:MAG: hypothetical protein QXR53_03760 [Candidatus Norongarragalinales archaeon]